MGKERRKVQVVMTEVESGECLSLEDEDGVFVDMPAGIPSVEEMSTTDARDASCGLEGNGESESLGELHGILDQVTEENRCSKQELTVQQLENARTLEELEHQKHTVAQLQSDLEATALSTRVEELERELRKERERERARSAWRLNCEQISRYDVELTEKAKLMC